MYGLFYRKGKKDIILKHSSVLLAFFISLKVPAEITVDEKLPYKEEIKIALIK